MVVALCGLAAAACSPGGPSPGPSREPAAEPFVVAYGPDGVALTDGRWIERVLERVPDVGDSRGPFAVALPGGRAAIVDAGRIAVARPHAPAVVRDCADCAGVAWTGSQIVTTRSSRQPDNSFEILAFDPALNRAAPVPAARLAERVSTSYPQENLESPTTLAADGDSVTVTYLSREGGVRRGPSIVARYGRDGRLAGTVRVDGVMYDAVVSPDGAYLALGLGGSGGACVTASDLTVLDLHDLSVLDLGSALPEGYAGDADATWSYATDLVWRDGKAVATSRLYATAPLQTCDPDPQLWTRTVDPATLEVVDVDGAVADAARWIGPGCDDLLTVTGRTVDQEGWKRRHELAARIGGRTTVLGEYHQLVLGVPAGPGCA